MPFDLTPLVQGGLYTRPELAALWGYRSYEALGSGVFTPRGAKTIVLFVTRRKQQSSTAYEDYISGDRLLWEGQTSHRSDLRVARAAQNGESIHLFFRDVHHTPFRYHGQVLLTFFRERRDGPSRFEFQLVHDMSALDDLRVHEQELTSLVATEREQVTKARIGQGRFRESLLDLWKGCAVTGVDRPDLLRASHIKPWRLSSNSERLDPRNGLLLLPQYDHLFDGGYITFTDDGRIMKSPVITDIAPDVLGIEKEATLRRISDGNREYLTFHRARLFLRSA